MAFKFPEIVECTLHFQRDLPEEDRIKFSARVMTGEEVRAHDQRMDDAAKLTGEEEEKTINAILKEVASGWRDIVGKDDKPLPFDDSGFNQIPIQARIIMCRQVPTEAGMGALKKKA